MSFNSSVVLMQFRHLLTFPPLLFIQRQQKEEGGRNSKLNHHKVCSLMWKFHLITNWTRVKMTSTRHKKLYFICKAAEQISYFDQMRCLSQKGQQRESKRVPIKGMVSYIVPQCFLSSFSVNRLMISIRIADHKTSMIAGQILCQEVLPLMCLKYSRESFLIQILVSN